MPALAPWWMVFLCAGTIVGDGLSYARFPLSAGMLSLPHSFFSSRKPPLQPMPLPQDMRSRPCITCITGDTLLNDTGIKNMESTRSQALWASACSWVCRVLFASIFMDIRSLLMITVTGQIWGCHALALGFTINGYCPWRYRPLLSGGRCLLQPPSLLPPFSRIWAGIKAARCCTRVRPVADR